MIHATIIEMFLILDDSYSRTSNDSYIVTSYMIASVANMHISQVASTL